MIKSKNIFILLIIIIASSLITALIYLSIETVDSTGDTGRESSIALDSGGGINIAYSYDTSKDLKYCNNTLGSWSCQTADSSTSSFTGYQTSVAVDSSDIIHICEEDYANSDLVYCNNTGGSWSCQTIDSTNNVGFYCSIAVDSSDKIHISEGDLTNKEVRYCNNTLGSWSCQTISSGTGAGYSTNIVIDSAGLIHIVSTDRTGGNLLYLNNSGGSWTSTTLSNCFYYASMVVDSSDNLHIACTNFNLDLIYLNNSGGSWTSKTIEAGTFEHPSIVVDYADRPHIKFNDGNNLRYCFRTQDEWVCRNLVSSTQNLGSSYRSLAVKLGRLTDSTTFLNFSHMSYFDEVADDLKYLGYNWTYPISILKTPSNSSYNYSLSQNFNCSTYSLTSTLKNSTLWAWNSTSYVVNNTENLLLSGIKNASYFENIILPREDIYEWNCYVCDNNNLCAFDTFNRTLIIDQTKPLIVFSSPANNSIDLLTTQDIEYNALDSVSLIDSCWYQKDQNGTNVSLSGCVNITSEIWTVATHNLTIWVKDSAGNENQSTLFFTMDITNPIVNNTGITSVTGSQTINFSFNASDTNLDSCWYSIFNSTGEIDPSTVENTSITCNSVGNSDTVSAFGTYNLTIYANDSNSNVGSNTTTFTLSDTAPIFIGGGGGGGDTIIINESKNWTMRASGEIGRFEISMINNSKRNLELRFKNKGSEARVINLTCVDVNKTVCNQVFFSENNFTLFAFTNTEQIKAFQVYLTDARDGDYVFNVKATDDEGKTEIVSVFLSVGTGGIFTLLISKIFYAGYLLLFLPLFFTTLFISYRVLKENPLRAVWSFVISLFVASIVVVIF